MRSGRGRGATCARWRRSRSIRPAHATSTTRSRPSALAGGLTRVGAHRRRRRARRPTARCVDREARRRATSVYVPGAVEPMLPHGALQRGLLARARRRPRGGHRRARARRRERAARRVLPLADPLRRAARLRAGRPHLRGRRGGGGAVGGAARRGAPAPPRALQRRARAARRARDRLARSPSSRSTRDGNVATITRARADGVPPPDRAPDDRRQRSGRRPARRSAACRACTASTSAPTRSASSGSSTSSPRSRCRRRRCREPMSPSQAAELVGEISRRVEEHVAAHRPRAPWRSARWCCARSSRPTTRRATSATPACTRRATATSPRRSAATPTSSATARCCRRSAAGSERAARRRARRSWARGPPSASARR